ncbi:hypothetical protein KP509_31G028900 [Ceratopteris richardii]|uniref:Uncharacterized protein n=2 Tax=Ceratopteris richardii TaxID=49495 RepID=A0A8T2QWX6_CERRI|nr:hypothetical protein KP509_31G028900 [Ceratopteris richardii]
MPFYRASFCSTCTCVTCYPLLPSVPRSKYFIFRCVSSPSPLIGLPLSSFILPGPRPGHGSLPSSCGRPTMDEKKLGRSKYMQHIFIFVIVILLEVGDHFIASSFCGSHVNNTTWRISALQ